VLVNSFAYLIALRVMLWPEHRWMLTVSVLALAAAHLAAERALPAKETAGARLGRVLFAGLALTFVTNLARAGIDAKVRLADAVQYDQRRVSYDFDMIEYRWEQSLSPGNEQTFYWGSAAADQQGTRNYMGVKSAAIDAMIAAMLRARDRADFVAAVRALDRVLISGCYVVPLFYLPQQWVARWTYVEHPARTSLYGYLPETWWHQPAKQGSALQ